MFLNLVTGRNSDYIDKVVVQVFIKKIWNFLILFCLLLAKVISPKANKFVKTASLRCLSKN